MGRAQHHNHQQTIRGPEQRYTRTRLVFSSLNLKHINCDLLHLAAGLADRTGAGFGRDHTDTTRHGRRGCTRLSCVFRCVLCAPDRGGPANNSRTAHSHIQHSAHTRNYGNLYMLFKLVRRLALTESTFVPSVCVCPTKPIMPCFCLAASLWLAKCTFEIRTVEELRRTRRSSGQSQIDVLFTRAHFGLYATLPKRCARNSAKCCVCC